MPYVIGRPGQIELKTCVHFTEGIEHFWSANCWNNWRLTAAKCDVPCGLSQRLCCNKRAIRICVAGGFNCAEGDPSLVAVTLHSHITVSPATCHPVQCRPNRTVADCTTLWVCKCLQLIYLSALHLTLFDNFWHLYYNLYNILFQSNESVLALWLSTRGLNLCGRYDLQESITSDGVWVLSRTNRLAMFKAWEPKAKLFRSSRNWNLVKSNLA